MITVFDVQEFLEKQAAVGIGRYIGSRMPKGLTRKFLDPNFKSLNNKPDLYDALGPGGMGWRVPEPGYRTTFARFTNPLSSGSSMRRNIALERNAIAQKARADYDPFIQGSSVVAQAPAQLPVSRRLWEA